MQWHRELKWPQSLRKLLLLMPFLTKTPAIIVWRMAWIVVCIRPITHQTNIDCQHERGRQVFAGLCGQKSTFWLTFLTPRLIVVSQDVKDGKMVETREFTGDAIPVNKNGRLTYKGGRRAHSKKLPAGTNLTTSLAFTIINRRIEWWPPWR